MATPCGNVSITFTSQVDASTLSWMNKAFWIDDWYGLRSLGPSVGENLRIAHTDGRLALPRDMDELAVELRGVFLNGKWTDDNACVTGVDWEVQARTYQSQLATFFDSGAKRTFDITLNDHSTVLTGEAVLEDMDAWAWPLWHVVSTSLLLTVTAGQLT